jgi:hypothetical protein
MQSRRTALQLSVVLALAATVPVSEAHHSFAAEFDADQPVELHGVITKMEWLNPHTWMHLDVQNADGTKTAWMIEGGTPNTLFRRGFTPEAVPVGTEITVIGYRARNGANRANGRDLVLADGRRLFMGSPGTGAPGDEGAAAE